ncbi:MAG: winged helix-turn-helix domain-containing protein [Chloroflexota bacterium]
MPDVLVAVLADPDTADRTVSIAGRLGLSVVLSRGGRHLVEETPQLSEARLLLLDLDAPGVDGLESCRQVRLISDIPLLALGRRGGKGEIIEALRAGADSCLPKPVDPELLEAHLEVLLRRRLPPASGPAAITVRELTVDFVRKEVLLQGKPVAATPAEYRLLACLSRQLGKAVPSSTLLREMSGYDCSEQEAQEIVKVHVSRLRAKIDKDPTQPSYLFNVRGFGYLLERRTARQS